jgi:ELWxxDGT repeat protein
MSRRHRRRSRHPGPSRSNWSARRRRGARRRNRPLAIERFERKLPLTVTPTLVADINQVSLAGNPADFLVAGDVAYFTAFDPVHGRELWKTDGTTAGTTLVADVTPGPASSSIASLTLAGGKLYFTDGGPSFSSARKQLWALDPATDSVELVENFVRTGGYGEGASLGVLGNDLFFWRSEPFSNVEELWKTSGTMAGAERVGVFGIEESSNPSVFTPAGDRLYFTARTAAAGLELHWTDGVGTTLARDIAAGASSSSPNVIAVAGDTVFFNAYDTTHGSELWRTDPAAGAVLVADLLPGGASSNPYAGLIVGDQLFLSAYDGSFFQLWRIDNPGSANPQATALGLENSQDLTVVGDVVYTAASDGEVGTELWRIPLAGGEPELVKNIFAPFAAEPFANVPGVPVIAVESEPNDTLAEAEDLRGSFVEVSPGVFEATISREEEEYPSEDWFRVSLPAGYQLQVTGPGGDKVIYDATGTRIDSLWSDDRAFLAEQSGDYFVGIVSYSFGGAPPFPEVSNTFRISVGDGDAFPSQLTRVGETVYFTASDPGRGFELWRTDAAAGAVLVGDLNPGPGSSAPLNLTPIGNELFFQANGNEVWKATEAGGAVKLATIGPDVDEDAGSGSYGAVAVLDGTLLFAADDGTSGGELWKLEAATGETGLLKDIAAGNEGGLEGSASYGAAAVFDGLLYFAATDESGTELWRTDGTEAGTVRVADIATGSSYGYGGPVAASSFPSSLTPAGDVLFFAAESPESGRELWKTDGTAAGTVLVADISPGTASSWPYQALGSNPADLTAIGSTLYFTADEGGNRRLWRTDGETTERVAAVEVEPFGLAAVDGGLFFTSSSPVNGSELHRLDAATGVVETFDFSPGPETVGEVVAFDGSLLFRAENSGGEGLAGLWRFVPAAAGQPAGRELVGGFSMLGSLAGNSRGPAILSGHLYFAADGGEAGLELWRTDGTAAGTSLVADVFPGTSAASSPNSSGPWSLTVSGDRLYFRATDASGSGLWESDGTAAGTTAVEFAGVTGFQPASPIGSVGGRLLLGGEAGGIGTELWSIPASEPQASPRPTIDLNGDGLLDGLWRDAVSGVVVGTLYDGFGGVIETRVLGGDADWTIGSPGDFDGDGVTDFVWLQASSGLGVMRILNADGSDRSSTVIGGSTEWGVDAAGDYDGDGRSDLIWRHHVSGINVMWLMDAAIPTQQTVIGGDTSWRLVSTDPRFDVNADGTTDLIWRHAPSGAHVVKRMAGASELSATVLGGSSDWEVVATGDFNADGSSDVLWRQASTGVVVQWLLVDAVLQQGAWVGGNLDWSVVGSEDADGDGRSDILWRQNSNGVTVVSLMNGSVQAGSTVLGGDLNWSILRRPGRQVG